MPADTEDIDRLEDRYDEIRRQATSLSNQVFDLSKQVQDVASKNALLERLEKIIIGLLTAVLGISGVNFGVSVGGKDKGSISAQVVNVREVANVQAENITVTTATTSTTATSTVVRHE